MTDEHDNWDNQKPNPFDKYKITPEINWPEHLDGMVSLPEYVYFSPANIEDLRRLLADLTEYDMGSSEYARPDMANSLQRAARVEAQRAAEQRINKNQPVFIDFARLAQGEFPGCVREVARIDHPFIIPGKSVAVVSTAQAAAKRRGIPTHFYHRLFQQGTIPSESPTLDQAFSQIALEAQFNDLVSLLGPDATALHEIAAHHGMNLPLVPDLQAVKGAIGSLAAQFRLLGDQFSEEEWKILAQQASSKAKKERKAKAQTFLPVSRGTPVVLTTKVAFSSIRYGSQPEIETPNWLNMNIQPVITPETTHIQAAESLQEVRVLLAREGFPLTR